MAFGIKLSHNITPIYFKFVTFLLHTIAAIPEEIKFNSELKTLMFNKVWPVVFFLIWTPLVPMVSLKIRQFILQKSWDDLLEIMHMFILGCNTLYYLGSFQKTAKHFKIAMDLVSTHFKTSHLLKLHREIWLYVLFCFIPMAFVMCFGANLYYWENLVPLWVPFIDNDLPPPLGVYIFIWFYEGTAGVYMVVLYGILGPFLVVMTTVIRNEIFFLIQKLEQFKFYGGQAATERFNEYEKGPSKNYHIGGNLGFDSLSIIDPKEDFENTDCYNERQTKLFIRAVFRHHQHIQRTIDAVAQIHSYIFFTQAFLTITHSCFLAFTMYYTNHLLKVIVKYFPLLVLSYYVLYLYSWNGQRLTDTCEELYRALYRCRWIGAPRSFKQSLLIIGEFCKAPVQLTGGGVFSASLHTFMQGVEQSVSYILILKTMTPERNAN